MVPFTFQNHQQTAAGLVYAPQAFQNRSRRRRFAPKGPWAQPITINISMGRAPASPRDEVPCEGTVLLRGTKSRHMHQHFSRDEVPSLMQQGSQGLYMAQGHICLQVIITKAKSGSAIIKAGIYMAYGHICGDGYIVH